MGETLDYLRQALPEARIVLQAVLPKGDTWPNRCTPAIDHFNAALQVRGGVPPPCHGIVLQAVLPKGDTWPNRCTPAIDHFNAALQVRARGLTLHAVRQ